MAKCQQSGGSAAEQIGRGLPEAIRGVVNGGFKNLFVGDLLGTIIFLFGAVAAYMTLKD